jgi:hypothetical protein
MFFSIFKASKQTLRLAQSPIQSVLGVKYLGQEVYHLLLSNVKVKNVWNCMLCTSTPLYTLTEWSLIKPGNNFTLYAMFPS